MSDLLKEFEEDIRREKTEAFWKNFGTQMVWLSIAIVIGTIGGVVWREYKASQSEKQSGALMAGFEKMDAGDTNAAIAAFDNAAKKASGGAYGIAMLSKAHAQHKSGDAEAARQTYVELQKESGGDVAAFASVARILAARDSKDIIEPVKGQPFYHAQLEWKAWQLLDTDKKEDAIAVFASLNDDINTPQGVRGRAAEALQLLAPEKLLPKTTEAKNDAK